MPCGCYKIDPLVAHPATCCDGLWLYTDLQGHQSQHTLSRSLLWDPSPGNGLLIAGGDERTKQVGNFTIFVVYFGWYVCISQRVLDLREGQRGLALLSFYLFFLIAHFIFPNR